MKIRLDSARFEPFRWQEVVAIPVADFDRSGLLAVDPVEVNGQLSFAEPSYLLDLRLKARVSVECDRCLVPVEVELSGRTLLVVAEGGARSDEGSAGNRERELGEDEMGVLEVAGEGFDSVPLVREQVLLDLPAKPLCREGCRGLCPVCGADRNRGECDCESRAIDPRWAALEAMKSRFDDAS